MQTPFSEDTERTQTKTQNAGHAAHATERRTQHLASEVSRVKCFLAPLLMPGCVVAHIDLDPELTTQLSLIKVMLDTDNFAGNTRTVADAIRQITKGTGTLHKVLQTLPTGMKMLREAKARLESQAAVDASMKRVTQLLEMSSQQNVADDAMVQHLAELSKEPC